MMLIVLLPAVVLLGIAVGLRFLLKRPLTDIGASAGIAAGVGALVLSYCYYRILVHGWNGGIDLLLPAIISGVGACLVVGPLFFRNPPHATNGFWKPGRTIMALVVTAGAVFGLMFAFGPGMSGLFYKRIEADAWAAVQSATSDSEYRDAYHYKIPEQFHREDAKPMRLLAQARGHTDSDLILKKSMSHAEDPIYKDAALLVLESKLKSQQYFEVIDFIDANKPTSPEYMTLQKQAIDGLLEKSDQENYFGQLSILDGLRSRSQISVLQPVWSKAFQRTLGRLALTDSKSPKYFTEDALERIITRVDSGWTDGNDKADVQRLGQAATKALADRWEDYIAAYLAQESKQLPESRLSWLWQIAAKVPKVRPNDPAFTTPREKALQLLRAHYAAVVAKADDTRLTDLKKEIEQRGSQAPPQVRDAVSAELAKATDLLYDTALGRMYLSGQPVDAVVARTSFVAFLRDVRGRPDKYVSIVFRTTFDKQTPPDSEAALRQLREEVAKGKTDIFGKTVGFPPTSVDAALVPATGSFTQEVETNRIFMARDTLESRLAAGFRGPLLRLTTLAPTEPRTGKLVLVVDSDVRYGKSFFQNVNFSEQSTIATARLYHSVEVRWTYTAFDRTGKELGRWTATHTRPPSTIWADLSTPDKFYLKALEAAYTNQADQLVQTLGFEPGK